MLALVASLCVLHAGGVLPDNGCTPGSYKALTRAEACAPKTRLATPATVREWVLRAYGVPDWTGADGEIDHRQPFWSGGLTNESNLWPQRGPRPNPKDRLEDYAYRRVCHGSPAPMRLSTVHRMFAGDWRVYLRRYHLEASSVEGQRAPNR